MLMNNGSGAAMCSTWWLPAPKLLVRITRREHLLGKFDRVEGAFTLLAYFVVGSSSPHFTTYLVSLTFTLNKSWITDAAASLLRKWRLWLWHV